MWQYKTCTFSGSTQNWEQMLLAVLKLDTLTFISFNLPKQDSLFDTYIYISKIKKTFWSPYCPLYVCLVSPIRITQKYFGAWIFQGALCRYIHTQSLNACFTRTYFWNKIATADWNYAARNLSFSDRRMSITWTGSVFPTWPWTVDSLQQKQSKH